MPDKEKNNLKVNEIFYSIQGESSFAGLPCVFVRLTYCNLRCSFCDTEYAFFEGTEMTVDEIVDKVSEYDCRLVEITGGEPLIQANVHRLMTKLSDNEYQVILETGGHMDISQVDERVHRIMDVKCPTSNESEKMLWENFNYLTKKDEVKFVIGDKTDFDYAVEIIEKYKLNDNCGVLLSPVFNKIDNLILAGWILENKVPVRMQFQMHKYIWSPDKRGV
jgi:7-carboxy-7-deazaguanine synthase